jgi:hypothetical protein
MGLEIQTESLADVKNATSTQADLATQALQEPDPLALQEQDPLALQEQEHPMPEITAEDGLASISMLELAEVLDQHRIWVESGGETGAKADLCGVSLGKAHPCSA